MSRDRMSTSLSFAVVFAFLLGTHAALQNAPPDDMLLDQEEYYGDVTDPTELIDTSTVALDELLSDAMAPDAAAPDALAPDTMAPDAMELDATAPDAMVPDAMTPDAMTPDATAPDAFPPDPIVGPFAEIPVWARYAPTVRLYWFERYYPTCVQFFIDHSDLRFSLQDAGDIPIADLGTVEPRKLGYRSFNDT